MKHLIGLILIFCILGNLHTQTLPSKRELLNHYGFDENSITVDGEKIVFYTFQKDNSPKSKLIVYLQGSDPSPLFSYRINKNEIQKLCFLKGEFRELSADYIYVAIEKIGFEKVIDEDNIPKPKIYQERNSLDNRVFRANEAINHLDSLYDFEKIIVYGHSEGAVVAAKLGTQNNKITHIGFWSGNALPDFFDFVLANRKQYYKGEISAKQSQQIIDETIDGFVNEIANDTANINSEGYTNLRWWSYSEPPINNLLKIDIPLYVHVATEDESAPIESTYLIPLEFARLGKKNLIYKVCRGCDHGFKIKKKNKKIERKWIAIFNDFISWTNEN